MSKISRFLFVLTMAITTTSAKIEKDEFSSTTSTIGNSSKKYSDFSSDSTISLSLNSEVEKNILKSAEKIIEISSTSISTISSTSSTTLRSTKISNDKDTKRPIDEVWQCPNITKMGIECSCDFPHTLRCTGDRTALEAISEHLKRSREGTISLLDVTVTGITTLPANFLQDVALHGLVVSTGELRRVNENAFTGLSRPLQALGLPNNLLELLPIAALSRLNGLERLDLSHNKLKTLEADSFRDLKDLTYLDLCDNLLSQLSPKAFEPLRALRSLRMRGNRLSISALSALRGLKNLEELDLSSNLLLGPLGPNLLPPMQRLRSLTVSGNELINVQQGALVGLRNLTYLSLSHNQIDVLEDHSFKHLSTLTRLDLASNRIVAVSSSSLAHLEKLTSLDLTHNFLRSLTADLVVPLKSLQDLRLDDNDITMVSSDVPTAKLRLKSLSLADNPLNCDCTLLEFANWLSNSSLEPEDKASAVCATPPALENGILTQVPPGSLLCGEPTPSIMTRVPLAGAQLTLKQFNYDRKTSAINLMWQVEPCTERYTCDNLIVYEAIGDSEVETESSPLHCDSTLMRDPCSLPVPIPSTMNLQYGHKYRYCVVLLVPLAYDEFSLGLGCSDVITLEETTNDKPPNEQNSENKDIIRKSTLPTEGKTISAGKSSLFSETLPISGDRINAVHVNISERGFLHIDVSLSTVGEHPSSPDCQVSVAVYEGESTVHREKLNCNVTIATMSGLMPGRYKVCASLDHHFERTDHDSDMGRSRCVEVQAFRQNTELIVIAVSAIACAVLIAIALLGRSIVKKFRRPRIQAQCFLPAQEFEITDKAHYIKLLATTKV